MKELKIQFVLEGKIDSIIKNEFTQLIYDIAKEEFLKPGNDNFKIRVKRALEINSPKLNLKVSSCIIQNDSKNIVFDKCSYSDFEITSLSPIGFNELTFVWNAKFIAKSKEYICYEAYSDNSLFCKNDENKLVFISPNLYNTQILLLE